MRQRGISLIELIMFIVIVSVALAGILQVMNVTTKNSADPLIHKQALAAAESLLEEIELQDFDSLDGAPHVCANAVGANCVTISNRLTAYHVVRDYDGFSMPAPPGIYALKTPPELVAGLSGYSARVAVGAPITIGTPPASAVLVTVTVTDPQGGEIAIDGYRTAY